MKLQKQDLWVVTLIAIWIIDMVTKWKLEALTILLIINAIVVVANARQRFRDRKNKKDS